MSLDCHRRRFNSRTPGGVRLKRGTEQAGSNTFQFTHPGRGATPSYLLVLIVYTVSIHAPREGCDVPDSDYSGVGMFQFTHPGRGATKTCDNALTAESVFQFTHPGRGATWPKCPRTPLARVSIHAPREGCDTIFWQKLTNVRSFNSRTPGGVRRLVQSVI